MVVGDSTMKRHSEKCTFLMLYIVVMIFINERRVGRGLDVMVTPLEVLFQVGMRLGMVVGDSTMKRHSEKCTFLMFYIVVMIFINEGRVGRGLDVMVAPLEALVQVRMRI